MEGMNASNCYPGLHIIAKRRREEGIRSSQSHLLETEFERYGCLIEFSSGGAAGPGSIVSSKTSR